MSKHINYYKNLRAYRHLSFFNLINHVLCNQILKQPYLAAFLPSMHQTTNNIFRKSLIHFIMKHTFCKVFTGGSNLANLNERNEHLIAQKIPRILSYCGNVVKKDQNEGLLDENATRFKEAALQASKHSHNMISLTISSLISTDLLKKYNKSIELRDKIWQENSKSGVINAQNLLLAFQSIYEGATEQDMVSYAKNIHNFQGQNISQFQITQYDFKCNHQPYYFYQSSKNKELLINIISPFNNQERFEILQMERRITQIFEGQYRNTNHFRIIIQPEPSYHQRAVESISQQLQHHYNQSRPYIFITLQSYLNNSKHTLNYHLWLSIRNSTYLAIQLVKGLYALQQQALNKEKSSQSPVVSTYEEISDNFLSNFQNALKSNTKGEVFITSNNEDTISPLLSIKSALKSQIKVNFIQTYGLGDHITYHLKDSRCSVYKMIPYGQIQNTAPLILKRVRELSRSNLSYERRGDLLMKEVRTKCSLL